MDDLLAEKKPVVLVFPFNLMAHYLRCLKYVETLEGKDVFFQSSSKYDHFVEMNGYSVFKAESFDESYVLNSFEKFHFKWLNLSDIERITHSIISIIKKFKPEFIIGDTHPCLKMACETTNTRYVSILNGYMTNYYALERGLPQKSRIRKSLLLLPSKLNSSITRFGEKIVFKFIHRHFNKIRRSLSLQVIDSFLEELEGDQTLICDDEFFYPQIHLPNNYSFIGPLIYQTNKNENLLINQLNPNNKNICISLGSSGNIGDWRFLNDDYFSDYKIIVTGKVPSLKQFKNVLTQEFINLEQILPLCSLLICHGGNGTIYLALKSNTPVICIPRHLEQEWNARRIEELGLGIFLKNNDSDKLVKTIQSIINKHHTLQ